MENQAPKPFREYRSALLARAREVKTSPGVYLMKAADQITLYVGKARNLRSRLTSYFQSEVHDSPRTEMMVGRVDHFDVILTETEAEALILEATLIKKHKPKFNIRLKDDKTYPYLKIQVQSDYPRIEWTRRVLRDGARYFGPFPSAGSARQVMQLLNETFRLRDCSENTFSHRSRPCILYQMGRCTAPCVGLIDRSSYQESVHEVISVLEGKADRLIQSLRKGMHDAADREEFETASFYRDQIRNLELITQTQGVFEAGSQRSRDVLGISRKETLAHATLLKIRDGKLISVQHYHLQNSDSALPLSKVLFDFLSQYYLSLKEKGEKAQWASEEASVQERLPTEVLVSEAPLDLELLEKTLEIQFRIPETSLDEQVLQVACANANYALEQKQKRTGGHSMEDLEEVQEKLHLHRLPERIECYDISNIQGQDAVASRVVFIHGAPEKELYRRYKIRTVEGANDFAMMKEVLERRFSNVEEALPDLVVVDGGKGQLSQATAILEELSIQGVGVVGLAKARVERNFRASEVKSSLERVFIPHRKNPVPLLPQTGAYRLLTHVRDEAHRFAISYHRLLRSKRSLQSKG